MPAVNTLVDIGNWFSLDVLLPIGIYDGAKLSQNIILRRGLEGETYTAIGNSEINLTDRYVLSDDQGPFGTPITDSLRTSITNDTTSTIMFIYASLDEREEHLRTVSQSLIDRITEICGGQLVNLQISDGGDT